MRRRRRIYYSQAQKDEMWDRWQRGESMHEIAKAFDRGHSSVQRIISETGGYRPPLRKQSKQPEGKVNECLADLIAPKDSGKADYIGGFAATAGIGIDEKITEFEKGHDDYNALMLKALADRLAEALTEMLHKRVRKEYWGYAQNEDLSNDELIDEAYAGIRPAIGYPAGPDHTEKDLLWELLDAENNTGIWLTESKAMVPTAAVSGLYFSHPESRYFAVGKINKDQVEDYARRKGMELKIIERWLSPNLAYDPE